MTNNYSITFDSSGYDISTYKVQRGVSDLERLSNNLNVYYIRALLPTKTQAITENEIGKINTGITVLLAPDLRARFVPCTEALEKGIELMDYFIEGKKKTKVKAYIRINNRNKVCIRNGDLLGYLEITRGEHTNLFEELE